MGRVPGTRQTGSLAGQMSSCLQMAYRRHSRLEKHSNRMATSLTLPTRQSSREPSRHSTMLLKRWTAFTFHCIKVGGSTKDTTDHYKAWIRRKRQRSMASRRLRLGEGASTCRPHHSKLPTQDTHPTTKDIVESTQSCYQVLRYHPQNSI